MKTHYYDLPWWRHQMEIFSALLVLCAGNSPVIGELPAQRPVTRSFDVFFDLRLNKRLSKQSGGWWFETPSRPLWRHSNVILGADVRNVILIRLVQKELWVKYDLIFEPTANALFHYSTRAVVYIYMMMFSLGGEPIRHGWIPITKWQ